MAPPRKITRDSLKRAPRNWLDALEQGECFALLDAADGRDWTEKERRRAAELEVKAWAMNDGTWNYELREAAPPRRRKLFR